MTKPVGLYIHVPFCAAKCPYCDFYSVPLDDATADAYAATISRALQSHPFGPLTADTLYIGGGTPSLLGATRLDRILQAAVKAFHLTPDCEITLEANPASTLRVQLQDLHVSGFNRISFGVQSAIDGELVDLGRLHTAKDAAQAITDAAHAGFQNISADLMLGIPHQTGESLARSIAFLTGLPLRHISAYLLKIEENTAFYTRQTAHLPDEDTLAQLYLDCVEQLERNGFRQYEISNFAKQNAASRHNLKYWRGEEYLGLGPSAHSYLDGKRFYFTPNLKEFIFAKNPYAHTVPDGSGGGYEEAAMLQLRLTEGLNAQRYCLTHHVDLDNLLAKARALEHNQLVRVRGDNISLTPQGFLLSNSVIAHLLYD